MNIENRWQVGDKIGGLYEVRQIFGGEGKSGMGIVYICYNHKHKSPYAALKTFQEKFLFDKEVQKLFEHEGLIWVELEKYPYIVCARWVTKLEGRLFIVLEYISPDKQGRNTLTQHLGQLTLPEILKFSIQFCYGMEYAYSKGIDSHCDIKPDNIMITADQTIKITDFGLAKAFQATELKEDIISQEQNPSLSIFQNKGTQICGTLPYMAPEQFDGYANKRSDIYSFGIVLYQMMTNGRLPFIGRTTQEWERLHKYEKISIISSPLAPVIQKCLEKDIDQRYQCFILLREELQDLLLKETGERLIPPQKEELENWEWSNKGIALTNLGRYHKAISCFDKAIELDPQDAISWSSKGGVLDSIFGRCQEAIACHDKALELNPRYATAWYNKGNALGRLGRYIEAIRCCDKALELNPRYADAWFNKGCALSYLGKRQEAMRCYDRVLKIDPNHRLAQVYKMRCL